MSKDPKFTSDFAILDVKHGRKALAKHIKAGATVPVTIQAEIVRQWSGDDGTSIEFELKVLKVTPA